MEEGCGRYFTRNLSKAKSQARKSNQAHQMRKTDTWAHISRNNTTLAPPMSHFSNALTKAHDLQHQKPTPRVAKEVEQQVKRAWPARKGSLSTGIWEHWSGRSLRPELSQQIPRDVPFHPTSICQRLRALSLPGPHTLSCSSSSSQGDTVGQQVVRP